MLVFITAIAKAIAKMRIKNSNFRHCRFPDILGFLEFPKGKRGEREVGWVDRGPRNGSVAGGDDRNPAVRP